MQTAMSTRALLTSIAALFLATGAAFADDVVLPSDVIPHYPCEIAGYPGGCRCVEDPAGCTEDVISAQIYDPPYFPWLTSEDRLRLRLHKNLPPVAFDHPFNGRLQIFILKNQQELVNICSKAWSRYLPDMKLSTYVVGCAVWAPALEPGHIGCAIFRLSDSELRKSGMTPNLVVRHEIGSKHPLQTMNGFPTIDGVMSERGMLS
jgi:hypothetical protein